MLYKQKLLKKDKVIRNKNNLYDCFKILCNSIYVDKNDNKKIELMNKLKNI